MQFRELVYKLKVRNQNGVFGQGRHQERKVALSF